jgi:hypothetical protein
MSCKPMFRATRDTASAHAALRPVGAVAAVLDARGDATKDEPSPWDDRDENWDAREDEEEGEDDFENLDPDPDDPIPGENFGLDFDEDEPEPDRGDFWPEIDDDEPL